MAAKSRIGWIGAGVMGGPMAGHLLAAGHEVAVFTRTQARAEELVRAGATWRASPAEVAADADVVFTMLGYPEDVRGVVLDDGGLLEAMPEGSLLIDTTTSEPSLAVEIEAAAARRGVAALDAPVSGGDVGARDGTLIAMVGGAAEAFERGRPLLDVFCRRVHHAGPAGTGQHTKAVNQIAISSGMVAMCEALIYATRAGLDVEATVELIGSGAAGSWSLTNYGPRILRGDFAPGFKIEHFLKDLGIALAEARRMRLALPGLALAEQLYRAAEAQGHRELGTQALVLALGQLSAVDLRSTPTSRSSDT